VHGTGHVRRKAAPVDALVTDLIIGRLSQPDAAGLIGPPAQVPDREALTAELAALRARRQAVLGMVADGTFSAAEAREAAAPLTARAGEIERELAASAAASPLSALPLGEPEDAVRERWAALPLGLKREIIRTLVTVTILKGKPRYPGGGYFSEDSIRVDWK
jgi:site-specific DNA recombinase